MFDATHGTVAGDHYCRRGDTCVEIEIAYSAKCEQDGYTHMISDAIFLCSSEKVTDCISCEDRRTPWS